MPNIASRNGHLPTSPPMVPGSSACTIVLKPWPMIPGRWPFWSFGASPPISDHSVKSATSASVTTPSQATSAGVPRDIVLSKR